MIMSYRLWDATRSRVPHTPVSYKQKLSFSFTDTSHVKTIGGPVLQYISLKLHLVSFLGRENILHCCTALVSIQVDTGTSTIALFLCCTDKEADLLHNYHFILLATLWETIFCYTYVHKIN